MKLKLLVSSILILLSSSAYSQKGITASYKANQLFIAFSHIGTQELYKKPVVQGRNVSIRYNVSFQSFEISYTDSMDDVPKKLKLSFVRYENTNSVREMIMTDGQGNPYTVYNDLEKNGSLSIVSHQLMENEYVVLNLIMDAEEVF